MSPIRILKVGLLGALLLAFFLACAQVGLDRISVLRTMSGVVEFFVPSISEISSRCLEPVRCELVLSSQWVFVPFYSFIFFIKCFPLSARVCNRMMESASAYNKRPNRFWLAVGFCIMLLDVLGSFGVISSPSFYNGGYLLDKTSPISLLFYTSKVFMVIYAWFSCIIEVLYFWLLLTFMLHWRFFFGPIDDWRERQLRN